MLYQVHLSVGMNLTLVEEIEHEEKTNDLPNITDFIT